MVIAISDLNKVDYLNELTESEIEETRGGFIVVLGIFMTGFAIGQTISQAQRKLSE